MKIQLTSVLVDDQAKAQTFYTEKLGFVTKYDIPMAGSRWLTLVSPEGHADVELLLEPMGIPEAVTFQQALFKAGIPMTAFCVNDIEQEFKRLQGLGVVFHSQPTQFGGALLAKFEDTCGNLLQIYQPILAN